jgi:sugar O-acyltransferase (sialic acid O-acetyltransferase NeuD family)
MKHRLLIVGAGGFGREALQWAEDALADGAEWQIGGFLDADSAALDGFDCGYPILEHPDEYTPAPSDLLVCAIGDPAIRMRVTDELDRRGARFTTLVHPTAIVGARSVLGDGSILCPRVTITTDVSIGRHVIMNAHASVGHDVTIGDCCSLFGHCDVTGGARLEEGALMGTHSCVLPGVRVGRFAKISAGSVVTRNVKPHTTMFGVPAKKLPTGMPSTSDQSADAA